MAFHHNMETVQPWRELALPMNTTPMYQKIAFGVWGVAALTSTSLWTGAIADKAYIGRQRTCVLHLEALARPSTLCDTSRDYGFFMIAAAVFILMLRGFFIFSQRHMHKYLHSAYALFLWGTTIGTIVMAALYLNGLNATCNSIARISSQAISCSALVEVGSQRLGVSNLNFGTIIAAAYAGWISSGLFFLMAVGESIALAKSFQVPDTLVEFTPNENKA
jgi:hypothetical protein